MRILWSLAELHRRAQALGVLNLLPSRVSTYRPHRTERQGAITRKLHRMRAEPLSAIVTDSAESPMGSKVRQ
jgi:hypothetical protein